eukprot:snap_masked-scaffold_10-processed-gene-8.12-mRNA-1 protein AED:1.00 eAED:1.00 QI:0/0/0/0/1/1/2/0/75
MALIINLSLAIKRCFYQSNSVWNVIVTNSCSETLGQGKINPSTGDFELRLSSRMLQMNHLQTYKYDLKSSKQDHY